MPNAGGRPQLKNNPATLITDIKSRIKGRVAIVGIGNIIRGDDGLGPKMIEMLKTSSLKAALFDCGTAPENYIFPILSSSADTIIFIDAADFSKTPGEIKVFDLDSISNVSFSTHSPSPHLFVDLLKTGKDGLTTFIISIQPKTTVLGESLSAPVTASMKTLKQILAQILA